MASSSSSASSSSFFYTPVNFVISVRDLLLFHKADRAAYDRLVTLGTSPTVARNVVALLMWLENTGIDALAHLRLHASNPAVVLRLVADAEAILNCVRSDGPPRQPPALGALGAIPLIATLGSHPLDLHFFHRHRDAAVQGLTYHLIRIGPVIFHDGLQATLASYDAAEAEARRRNLSPPPLPPELARPYMDAVAELSTAAEDERSIFITFSRGYPLSQGDIEEYFSSKWGKCVEKVTVARSASAVAPVYGKVVFKNVAYLGLVLNGMDLVKFTIKGK
ncbi:uncharacterized protein LOC121980024 [Zingiber officinale]|uniref:Uncharacterized protein n=1 Tax=Zingiber officinale TaxID=94328 RepID=A0A8J5LCG8_ZINOF|nr:uncharacterized protein LOC121980024 [Zingiber officinale]KAG6508416.1 hypothetical protein ZIOFF_033790 [Zingiber officinale]